MDQASGNSVKVTHEQNPFNHSFEGRVKSYSYATGAIEMEQLTNFVGFNSAIESVYIVNLDGIDGPTGLSFF